MDDHTLNDRNTVLRQNMKQYGTLGFVIACVSIFFFPLLLLGALLQCIYSPGKWDWGAFDRNAQKEGIVMFRSIMIPLVICLIVWCIICIIGMFFVVGFILLPLLVIFAAIFYITAMAPLNPSVGSGSIDSSGNQSPPVVDLSTFA